MAFVISRGKPSSENEKVSECGDNKEGIVGPVSNKLCLKSCSKESSGSLDKQLVLRRIRHRRSLNKVKSACEALLGTSQANNPPAQVHNNWLEPYDAFSAP